MATFGALYQDALDVELGSNDSAVLFTTARRKHAINEGYRQFADLTECLTRQSTVTVSTGAQEYNLLSTTVLSGGDFVRVASQGPVYQTFDSNGSLSQSLAGDAFPQRAIPQPAHRLGGISGPPVGSCSSALTGYRICRATKRRNSSCRMCRTRRA